MNKRKQFQLEQGKDEIISAGGNAIAGSYLKAIFRSSIPENFVTRRADAISDRDILATMTGLLSNAHTDFTNVKLFAGDEVFISSFGIKKLPSEETLRLRLDEFKPTSTYRALNTANLRLLKERQLSTISVGGEEMVPVAFEVIERLCDHDGNRLLIPTIEVNTFWTNLTGCSASEVIELYHSHGASEQFHSELKSDMNIEQLPFGQFAVNTSIMHCAMIAFNILRTIGQEVIRHSHLAPIKIKVKRWRLKTVLRHIIYSPVRIIRHARSTRLRFGKLCPWFDVIKAISSL